MNTIPAKLQLAQRILLVALPLLMSLPMQARANDVDRPPYHEREEVQNFVKSMVEKHGFSKDELQNLFAGIEFQASVVKAMEPPASPNVRSWERYKSRFVNQNRINRGIQFMREYAEPLTRARQKYGVPEEIITAIIGVETLYGRHTGNYRVIDALTTLAFDYPRRAEYFLGELEQYLLLTREQSLDQFAVFGSYAGAIGLPQFMPTNVRKLAVDFDQDGQVDLRNSVVDAIGSVAKYLAEHGWKTGEPVTSQIVFNDAVPDTWLQSILPVMSKSDIEHVSFTTSSKLDATRNFAVIPLVTPEKPSEFWLGFDNFYVITRYNKSTFYAMSVFQLAEAIAQHR